MKALPPPPATVAHDIIDAERALFRLPGLRRVRILGINALSVLHRHAPELVDLLRFGGTVELLLLDPETEWFRLRQDHEEIYRGRVADRLLAVMCASISIVRDILNQMLHQHDYDIETVGYQLHFRLHDRKPNASMLYAEGPEDSYVLFRDLSRLAQGVRLPQTGTLAAANPSHPNPLFDEQRGQFLEVWQSATPVRLERLRSDFKIVAPGKSDVPHLYAQAVDIHSKGRLDEATNLYAEVLRLDAPQSPSPHQNALAKRFSPEVFVTPQEPFALKDVVVTFHPEPSRRLIGYHLIWEDDIDFLTDNDPADHEIVWVKYSKDERVEAAWAYWHGEILTTAEAVPGANANGGRIKVAVQWGKHGSLLASWHEKIGIDQALAAYPEYETLQFKRLTVGRLPAQGHYADRWPVRFEGNQDQFTDFSVEVDVVRKLEEHQMVVVTRYPNAVLTGWHLPYNVRPKRDWPLDGP